MKFLVAVLLVLIVGRSALAQCCHHCGCADHCQKVCRVICEVKQVPKAVYSCVCEDFCVPGPSIRSTECDDCGHKQHVYTPGCGKVRTRTKLVKHETFEEKVSYKWVVETLCGPCAQRCAANDARPGRLAPPALAASVTAANADHAAQPASFQSAASDTEIPSVAPPREISSDESSRFNLRRIFGLRVSGN